VEDNPGDVRLIREALRGLEPPINISVAADGEQALCMLRNGSLCERVPRPGLIFLDFNLPKADSRSILRTIKEDEQLRMIPIAVLTSSDSERDVRDAYMLHANCYLKKPVELDAFLHTIQTAANFWLSVAYFPRRRGEAPPSAFLL
jgi:two-component system, chemotaxis family, response regulator Rcp1